MAKNQFLSDGEAAKLWRQAGGSLPMLGGTVTTNKAQVQAFAQLVANKVKLRNDWDWIADEMSVEYAIKTVGPRP